jgi:hypothetical protein
LFAYSDTLIRLYPLRLFEDGVLALGLFTGLGAIILTFCLRKHQFR